MISAVDPQSKAAYVFTDTGQLHDAIKSYGFLPIHEDGTYYRVQEFQGGYLLDGAPINVWMGEGWFAGQQEALAPFWQNGTIPRPPAALFQTPTVAMPPEVAANYAAYQQSQQGFFGVPTEYLLAGAGVLAVLFLSRRR